MWSTTWDIDQELGTDYHERLKAWLVSAQERDITLAGALTDPKGNRRLGPSKQADPDMYLRIVKRRPDGIVVRGAKVMICGTAAANEIFVMPGMQLAAGGRRLRGVVRDRRRTRRASPSSKRGTRPTTASWRRGSTTR